jgi:hypothetical protein
MPPLKNRVGQIYGRLTVIAQAESHNKQTCWLCRCICGIEVVRSGHDLHRGASLSCGCLHRETAAALRFKDLTGQVFGRLTVISRAPNHQKKVRWNCQCECGSLQAHICFKEVKNEVVAVWRETFYPRSISNTAKRRLESIRRLLKNIALGEA